jgi:hypothetical protein
MPAKADPARALRAARAYGEGVCSAATDAREAQAVTAGLPGGGASNPRGAAPVFNSAHDNDRRKPS